jgi:hypothetical protein
VTPTAATKAKLDPVEATRAEADAANLAHLERVDEASVLATQIHEAVHAGDATRAMSLSQQLHESPVRVAAAHAASLAASVRHLEAQIEALASTEERAKAVAAAAAERWEIAANAHGPRSFDAQHADVDRRDASAAVSHLADQRRHLQLDIGERRRKQSAITNQTVALLLKRAGR